MKDELLEGLEEIEETTLTPIQQKMKNFLSQKDDDEAQNVSKYAKTHVSFELEVKQIRAEQKKNKADAKAEGVSIPKINALIKEYKKYLAETSEDVSLHNTYDKILKGDPDFQPMLNSLFSKAIID